MTSSIHEKVVAEFVSANPRAKTTGWPRAVSAFVGEFYSPSFDRQGLRDCGLRRTPRDGRAAEAWWYREFARQASGMMILPDAYWFDADHLQIHILEVCRGNELILDREKVERLETWVWWLDALSMTMELHIERTLDRSKSSHACYCLGSGIGVNK